MEEEDIDARPDVQDAAIPEGRCDDEVVAPESDERTKLDIRDVAEEAIRAGSGCGCGCGCGGWARALPLSFELDIVVVVGAVFERLLYWYIDGLEFAVH